MIRTEPDQVAAFVAGPEAGLAPLAGPGERGCGVCGRKGHRRGSPKCLGENDPAKGTMLRSSAMSQEASAEDRSAQTFDTDQNEVDNGDKPAWCRCTTRSKGWTAPVDGDGPWVCGDCGLPSRAGQIDGTGRPADPMATVLEVAHRDVLTGESNAEAVPDESTLDGHANDHPVMHPFEAGEGSSGMVCTRMVMRNGGGDACGATAAEHITEHEEPVRGELHIGPAAINGTDRFTDDPDPFDEDGSDALTPAKPLTWLERIQAAESKADLRDIRAEALEAGEWTQELTAAGLERMTSFAPKG